MTCAVRQGRSNTLKLFLPFGLNRLGRQASRKWLCEQGFWEPLGRYTAVMVFDCLVDYATDISVSSSDVLPALYILAAIRCIILFELNKSVEVANTREQ